MISVTTYLFLWITHNKLAFLSQVRNCVDWRWSKHERFCSKASVSSVFSLHHSERFPLQELGVVLEAVSPTGRCWWCYFSRSWMSLCCCPPEESSGRHLWEGPWSLTGSSPGPWLSTTACTGGENNKSTGTWGRHQFTTVSWNKINVVAIGITS